MYRFPLNIIFCTMYLLINCLSLLSRKCPFGINSLCISVHEWELEVGRWWACIDRIIFLIWRRKQLFGENRHLETVLINLVIRLESISLTVRDSAWAALIKTCQHIKDIWLASAWYVLIRLKKRICLLGFAYTSTIYCCTAQSLINNDLYTEFIHATSFVKYFF